MKHLHIIILFLLLASCRTQTVVLPESHQRDSLRVSNTHRYDSTYEKDSISFSFTEIPVMGAYRSKPPAISDSIARIPTMHHWHTRTHNRMVTHTDTVTTIIRDSIPYPVEVMCPSRRTPLSPFHRGDAPRFYVRCTLGFFLLLLALLAYIALRIYLRR